MAGWSAYQNLILPEQNKNRVTKAMEGMQTGNDFGDVEKPQQDFKPVSTFWQDPLNVAKYYSMSQGYEKPEWMDDTFTDFINQAYSAFEIANQGSDWTTWKKLRPDDPSLSFLGSMAAPPEMEPAEVKSGIYPTGVADNMNYTTGGMSETQWEALPIYQKWLYDIFSGGKSAGAAIGGLAGIPGGPAGIAAGAGLGAGLGAISEKAPWLASVFDKLDIFAEGVERALGTASILTSGEIDAFGDLEAAWKAGHLTYDVARLTENQMIDLTKQQEKVTWTDDELLMEAFNRIRTGEDVDNVYASIQERTGFSGQMRDLFGHMIFDPLNFAGAFAAKGVGVLAKGGMALGLASDALRPLSMAADASKGLVDLGKKYGTELRMSVPVEKISNMDGISRWLGGVNKAGDVTALKKPEMPTGVTGATNRLGGAAITGSLAGVVGAGVLGVPGALLFGGLGALYGGKKGLSYLVGLTPASRALEINDMVMRNAINATADALNNNDHKSAIHYIDSFTNMDRDLAAVISQNVIDAPDAAALPLALKAISPKLHTLDAVWDATKAQRSMLDNMVRAMGGDPKKDVPDFIKRMADEKQLDILYKQVEDAARKTNNEDLIRAIDDGSFTPQELKNVAKIFVENKAAYSEEMWKAQFFATIMDDTAEWSGKWFGVEPDPALIRMSKALKNAQSLVLLGLNPNYLVNNFVNNMVTMARDGVFGMRSQDAISVFWSRVGFEPARLRQGVGAIGEMEANKIISKMGKKGDWIDRIGDKSAGIAEKLGIFSKMSASMESWSSAQAMTSGYKSAWGKLWKPGRGFDRLPMELQQALGKDITDIVHSAIQRGMNRAEIEKALWSDLKQRPFDDILNHIGSDQFRNAVDNLELKEFMAQQLGDSPTSEQIIKAFDELDNYVFEQTRKLHEQHVRVTAERIKNKIGVSGAVELIDLFAEDSIGMEATDLAHWRANDDIWKLIDSNPAMTSKEKNMILNAHYKSEDKRYGLWKKQNIAEIKAITDVLGTADETSTALIGTKQKWYENWSDFYRERRKLSKRVWGEKGDIVGSFPEYERQMLDLYKKHVDIEHNIEKELNMAIEQMIRVQFGDAAGDATGQWRVALIGMRDAMRDEMTKHRESLMGMSHGERTRMWDAFVPTHKQRIMDYYDNNFKQPQGTSAGMPMGYMDQFDDANHFSALDDWWHENKYAFDEIRRVMLSNEGKYGETLGTKRIDAATKAGLKKYLGGVYNQLSETKNVSLKFAEDARDMALLNYNRRRGFDTVLTSVMPYQFWYTRSMMNWGMRALDNPGWLASWARIRSMQNQREQQSGYPTRLQGMIQVEMPGWMPDWMGDTAYIDPMRQLFPHELLMQPVQRWAEEGTQVDKRARYILEQWFADETYSQPELQGALDTKTGAVWDKAVAQARMEIESDFNNPMDFLTAISGPLLPIGWAYNLMQGKKEKIGELPVTRAIQALTSFVTPGGINVEAPLRKALGLKVGGEYQDYYIDRELSNMAAVGLITPDEAMRAMIDRTGEAFTSALDRVSKVQGVRYFTSSFATDVFPEGEQNIRALHEEFRAAMDAGTVSEFFDKHPEYATRAMMYAKTPEEKLRKFTISSIWNAWEELPDLTKREMKQQLGDAFNQSFMSSETRSYDSISTDKLVAWARAMNAQLPQKAKEYGLNEPQAQLSTPGETAIYQWFNDERQRLFGDDIFGVNSRYYSMKDGSAQRRSFLKLHPELIDYWNWTRGIKEQYPQIQELQDMTSMEVQPEFRIDIKDFDPVVTERLLGYFYAGQPLGEGARRTLYNMWLRDGKPTEKFESYLELLRSYFVPQ